MTCFQFWCSLSVPYTMALKHLRSFILLFLIATAIYSQDPRSILMNKMSGWQFSCLNTTCFLLHNSTVATIINCQTLCLLEHRCQALTFYMSSKACELFGDIPNSTENMLSNANTITMMIIYNTNVTPGQFDPLKLLPRGNSFSVQNRRQR